MKELMIFLLEMALGCVLTALMQRDDKCDGGVEYVTVTADTLRVTDTLTVTHPMVRSAVVVRHDTVKVMMADSVAEADSAWVVLAVEQRVYEQPGWRAVVSGVNPQLDTLMMRCDSQRVVINRIAKMPASRWSLSVGAGMALTPRGIEPGLMVGVSYRLIDF